MNTQLTSTLAEQALEVRRDAFTPAEHSMETVAEINGAVYVNDSKATSVQATRFSLGSITGNKVVLITGGDDHRNDYASLTPFVREKVRTVIYLGSDKDHMLKHISKEEVLFMAASSVEEAVTLASQCAHEGEVVLFSPACPSFDPFDNYKNRGNKFRKLVNNLIQQN
jgi:UDP-N-acetylmuramoylalanine--D-glutamate ligase